MNERLLRLSYYVVLDSVIIVTQVGADRKVTQVVSGKQIIFKA